MVLSPYIRKAKSPNRNSPRIAPCRRVRDVVRRSCREKIGATVRKAMPKRRAIIERGGIPSSPIFIRR